MTTAYAIATGEPGVFPASASRADIEGCYRANGFVVLRGLFDVDLWQRMAAECAAAQAAVLRGTAPARHGSVKYLDDAGKVERVVNYVERVELLSPAVLEAATAPALVEVITALLGPDHWLNTQGVVYQDARPGRESGYSRIGWHSDWQSAPSRDAWPATAFTFHLDATSPANGFLRVVPGSHLWATPAPYRNVNNVPVPADARPTGGYTDTPPPAPMPLGFEKVPGELALYAEAGDVLLHDAYLWHSAARATDDDAVRRHVRSGYFIGDRQAWTDRPQFIKNAAR